MSVGKKYWISFEVILKQIWSIFEIVGKSSWNCLNLIQNEEALATFRAKRQEAKIWYLSFSKANEPSLLPPANIFGPWQSKLTANLREN